MGETTKQDRLDALERKLDRMLKLQTKLLDLWLEKENKPKS